MKDTRTIVPSFIVIGAMRAATTTLYSLLARHPRIGMSRDKETDFFIENDYERKWPSYHAQFEAGYDVYGEVSPNYSKRLVFPMAARRIAQDLPETRLVYVLRDPVRRFASHYKHLQQTQASVPDPAALPGSRTWHRMLDASLYHRQIEAYAPFFEAGRLLIVDFDRLAGAPRETLAAIGAHIGVPEGWDAVVAGTERSENSSGELSRIPRWILRLNEGAGIARIKRAMPRGLVRGVRSAVARGPSRKVPPLGEDVLELARREIAPDAAALRRLTGLAFERWSV